MVLTSVSSHLPVNTITPGAFFRQYKLIEQIGVGGQGVVWSALDQSQNRIYAIKFNETPDSEEAEAADIRDTQQLKNLVQLQHDHILPIREYGFEGGVRFTVSPYIAGGTLTERIKSASLSFDEILQFGAEIASALDYLHAQGVIHRDLKSSNILLDMNNETYLADFGLARLISTSTLAFHTGHGTPPYAPPEQVQLKGITPKSDIFSFGILFYELFTGQLPWNGTRQLGMAQSHSEQEIPDPREINQDLPPQVVDVLRRVTAADPKLRPNSAGDILKMFYYVFKNPSESQPKKTIRDEITVSHNDADELLKRGLAQWESTNGAYNLGMTKFALLDLERERINMDAFGQFMLSQSLTYGYNNDYWWSIVDDPQQRLAVSSILLGKKNDAITARVTTHLTNDLDIRVFPKGLPKSITMSLLDIGTKTHNTFLRHQIFEGIRTLTRPGNAWNDVSLDPTHMSQLGDLALDDSDDGDAAANLIGHLRSAYAVQMVLDHFDEERKLDALLLIQQAAGSLPALVPGRIRNRLSLEWTVQRLIQHPANLIGAYFMAFLGAALGVGMQNYLTINLTDLFDSLRIISSIERGLIIGSVFGFGIFLIRVIVERLRTSNTFLRVTAGTILGGLILNIALLILHVIILQTPPMGWLITLGCVMISFAIAISSLFRTRLVKMFFSSASIFIAISGTWWVHINYATSNLELTPIFKYDPAWSLAQISLTALGVALMIGVFGHLVNLAAKEE